MDIGCYHGRLRRLRSNGGYWNKATLGEESGIVYMWYLLSFMHTIYQFGCDITHTHTTVVLTG